MVMIDRYSFKDTKGNIIRGRFILFSLLKMIQNIQQEGLVMSRVELEYKRFRICLKKSMRFLKDQEEIETGLITRKIDAMKTF